jgi:hypothetical protein
MSSGGGKGGKKQTETTIPSWIQQPAERNIRRAEQVQQLKYMPYTGAEVAAFTPAQEAAMNNNIGAAKAFGLLDPNSNLTATTGMPEATTYANGMRGYGSIGLYDQALKELTARDPANMAAYNSLFGNAVPAIVARQTPFGGGGGGGGGGGVTPRPSPSNNFTPNYDDPHFQTKAHTDQISPTSTVSESDNAYRNLKPTRDYSTIKNQISQERAAGVGNYGSSKPKSSVKKYTATNNPRIGGRYGL